MRCRARRARCARRARSVGALLFRWRSWTPVPLALWAVARARPRRRLVAWGLLLALVGLAGRLWAVAWIGPRSRTRRATGGPDRLASRGPYAFVRHPIYLSNGLLSEGLLIASGASWPWLQILFPLLWLLQYGPIMRWEEAELRRRSRGGQARMPVPPADHGNDTHSDSSHCTSPGRPGVPLRVAAPCGRPGAGWCAAWRSERRTRQAVILFLVVVAARALWRARRRRP